jgi:hypothetical protein
LRPAPHFGQVLNGRVVPATLLFCGLLVGGGNFVYPYLAMPDHLLVWNVLASSAAAACAAAVAQRHRWDLPVPILLICVAGIMAAYAVQYAAQAWWPNAADEYGYLFLADTLLHGRLWNSAPPIPNVFDVAWICVRDGKWFSQYPPAWPVLLTPFLALHRPWLLNPLLTGALGVLEYRSLCAVGAGRREATTITAWLILSPFVLFNGASLFPHIWMADLVIALILLDVQDQKRPARRNKLLIGAALGLMLLTRYEGFAITAALYSAERIWRSRTRFLPDMAWVAVGGLPFAFGFTAYNAGITGHPFRTPYAWASPGAKLGLKTAEYGLPGAIAHALLQTLHWAGEATVFAGLAAMVVWAAAFISKLQFRQIRWYDCLLPATLIFFFFYPNSGGHEFGPRYWLSAWPAAMLTIAHLCEPDGWLRIGQRRWHLATLVAGHLAIFAGTTAALATFNRAYVEERRQVFDTLPRQTPAILLIPSREIEVSRFQQAPIPAWANDFARNGVELSGKILYGMADDHFRRGATFQKLACSSSTRTIFIWENDHDLQPVVCLPNQR